MPKARNYPPVLPKKQIQYNIPEVLLKSGYKRNSTRYNDLK